MIDHSVDGHGGTSTTFGGDSITYDNVIHRKVPGSLTLTSDAVTFHSSSETSAAVAASGSPLSWGAVSKHQVSPANYPKHLLKLVLTDGKPSIYQMPSREDLERIRADVSKYLQTFRDQHPMSVHSNGSANAPSMASPAPTPTSMSGKKRPHSEVSPVKAMGKVTSTSFGQLDADALAVTRSSLLAANPTLRAQHQYLVKETETLSEDDFWKTHQDLLEEEYARISGMTRAGTSSLLQSHLQLLTGRVTLGVEEMRQIFILYPAVHKAYEEKVPLELSDEQFWRKYLESEYFHRDRGRLGAASRQQDGANGKKKKSAGPSMEEQDARVAAVGTDDLFSRYDQKIREEMSKRGDDDKKRRRWGAKLAVGQFDLASTFETERGDLLEGPRDYHPMNGSGGGGGGAGGGGGGGGDDGKGAKVIQKYNRHWAMVLHPEHAVAGSNLMEVARTSVTDVLQNDDDAKARGGLDKEMTRLVQFASAPPEKANHASGTGDPEDYEELTLKNIEVYYSAMPKALSKNSKNEKESKRKAEFFSRSLAKKMTDFCTKIKNEGSNRECQIENAFPPAELGKELLKALTDKMAADSKTDADALEVVNNLPEEFKKKLQSYFRRSSELLRHFFGLRRLADGAGGAAYNEKLKKIVTGMETVYREMNEMRNGVTATGGGGDTMRKMCFQIMDQLDWAFKLHREGTGTGGGGGFVTIESF